MNSTLIVAIHIYVLLYQPKFSSKHCNQIASLTASAIDMYSASVVNNATVDYSVNFQLIDPLTKVNTYPVIDCRLSKSPV